TAYGRVVVVEQRFDQSARIVRTGNRRDTEARRDAHGPDLRPEPVCEDRLAVAAEGDQRVIDDARADTARRSKERLERRQPARAPEAPERANRGLAHLPLVVGEPVDQYGNGLGRTDPAERPDRERAAPWNAPPRRTGEGVDRADLAERLERAPA